MRVASDWVKLTNIWKKHYVKEGTLQFTNGKEITQLWTADQYGINFSEIYGFFVLNVLANTN